MKSLSLRMAFVLASVLFVLVAIAGNWIERELEKAISTEEVSQARTHAQTLLASLQILMINGQGTLARDWVESMHGTAGIVNVEVYRRDGSEAFSDLSTVNEVNGYLESVVFQRAEFPPHHLHHLPSKGEFFEQALLGQVVIDTANPREITVLQPIKAQTECMSCHGYDAHPLRGVLSLTLSRDQALARIDEMRSNLWVIAFILVAVLALAVWSVLRISVLRPINRLRAAITRVGSGERNVKLDIVGRDEISQVAEVFNAMQIDLQANEARIRAVADNVFDAIVTVDDQGIIDSVNHAAEKMFGYEASELEGQSISSLMPSPYNDDHAQQLESYLATGQGHLINSRLEVVGLCRDGSTFPMEIALNEMYLGDSRYFVAIARDITELKRQTAALQFQALHDGLTELPNRILLSDRIRQGILLTQRNKQQMSLLVMDLDRFKDINDTLGHQYGDWVLQEVARRMRHLLRESDTIARLGGDEFAVLLPNTDIGQAVAISEKLLHGIDAPFYVQKQLLHVGASIGITMFPEHGKDEVALLQRADVAMYVAKQNHLGYSIYDPDTDQHSLHNLALLGELRLAIDQDQLYLEYQPKINLATGKIYGVEALVRWQHPVHGYMPPDSFIPLAEQTGIIGELSEWVFGEAIKQCLDHRPVGVDMHVAVNVSLRNMQDPDFAVKIGKLINEMCHDPSNLRVEITETAIMENPKRALEALKILNDIGVHLSIDDFGTGYSSLAHLKQMPVDELKIDKSFVQDMSEDESDAVIVHSIIDLAHNIGIKVVAEGVEDKKTYDMLKALGCDSIQGFYVSKPMSAPDLVEWIKTSPWGLGDDS